MSADEHLRQAVMANWDDGAPAAPSSEPGREDFRTALTKLVAGLIRIYGLDVQAGRDAGEVARVMDEARIRFNTETRGGCLAACHWDARQVMTVRMALNQLSAATDTGAERALIAGMLDDLRPGSDEGDGRG